MAKKPNFVLKEEHIFHAMIWVSIIALYLPVKLSESNKHLNPSLFKSNYHFWGKTLIVISLILLTASAFYLAFRILNQYLIINNNPISKIRSAAQGYIEIEGIQSFLPGKTLLSPISKTSCTWYAYTIEEKRTTSKGNTYWAIKEQGESKEHFMLVDSTGQCIICPEGADVFTDLCTTWVDIDNPKLRYTERLITPNEYVYITGFFRTLTLSQTENLSDKRKKIAELIKKWKSDYAALLEKYDTNKNNTLDEEEWRNVINAAEQEINSQYPNTSDKIDDSKNSGLINIISKEGRLLDQPFLISTVRKKEVLKKFYGKFILYLFSFFISAMAACTPDTWYFHFIL